MHPTIFILWLLFYSREIFTKLDSRFVFSPLIYRHVVCTLTHASTVVHASPRSPTPRRVSTACAMLAFSVIAVKQQNLWKVAQIFLLSHSNLYQVNTKSSIPQVNHIQFTATLIRRITLFGHCCFLTRKPTIK